MHFLLGLFKRLFYFFFLLADLLLILAVCFLISVTIKTPVCPDIPLLHIERQTLAPDFYKLGNSWLKKSDSGLWEMYIEGNGFERGVAEGKLNQELAKKQEVAFVNQIKKMIPSEKMLHYLRFFIAFFNRHLDEYVPEEYKREIYGESLYASDSFNFIAPNYYRMLNYHAAHDIGHALQDKNMTVGCTAFGAWDGKTDDHTLLVGRNFDFYVGDEFAEDKLINFVKPDSGYKLMMVSWAGMIGTVSGMNEKGLTVTINASKSEIPSSAATPISIVAREILQYASDISEALAIARKRKTFVSESILIGSLKDNRTATIEKTPSRTELFETETKDFIICANHYQCKSFEMDPANCENIAKSSSFYRLTHLQELLDEKDTLTVGDAAAILRDRSGIGNSNIGMGNEKSLNQLIAHHSVIFKPAKLQVWVSTNPYQLGKYICYDLDRIFAEAPSLEEKKELYEKDLNIPADPFVYSADFKKFKAFKRMREAFQFAHRHKIHYAISEKQIADFISCNPEFWETYYLVGNYYNDEGDHFNARKYLLLARSKEVTTMQDKEMINEMLDKMPYDKIKFQF
jgi:isopenicillin-N N-acyltransferase like protein